MFRNRVFCICICIRADISICMLCSETCTYGKYNFVNVWKRWKRNLNICTKDLHIWKETYTYGKETNIYIYWKPGFLTRREWGPACMKKRPVHVIKETYMYEKRPICIHVRNLGSWLIETEDLYALKRDLYMGKRDLTCGKETNIYGKEIYILETWVPDSSRLRPCSDRINVTSPYSLPWCMVNIVFTIFFSHTCMSMSRPHTLCRVPKVSTSCPHWACPACISYIIYII